MHIASSSDKCEVVVVSPCWPSNSDGYGIAVNSLTLACERKFCRTHFIGIAEQQFCRADSWRDSSVEWVHAKTVSLPKWWRFAVSLLSSYPAVTLRYQRAEWDVLRNVARILAECGEANRELVVIVEDIPTACLVPKIRERFPYLRIAIRSHNLLTTGFERLAVEGHLMRRLPWKLEVAKIRRFEKSICGVVDHLWAITSEEAEQYRSRLNIKTDGVMGVCLDVGRYQEVKQGDAKTVVHVGTADLRKGKGLADFIRQVWPNVRTQIPDARLVLAGRGTERFANVGLGIQGLGFVEDDRSVLCEGLIFANPQQIGAGVQLKSIVAMLAGKALVSTRMGVDGVQGMDGECFVSANSHEEMASQIVCLMRDSRRASQIGQRAREMAANAYSTKRFLEVSSPLLDAFVSKSPKGDMNNETSPPASTNR